MTLRKKRFWPAILALFALVTPLMTSATPAHADKSSAATTTTAVPTPATSVACDYTWAPVQHPTGSTQYASNTAKITANGTAKFELRVHRSGTGRREKFDTKYSATPVDAKGTNTAWHDGRSPGNGTISTHVQMRWIAAGGKAWSAWTNCT